MSGPQDPDEALLASVMSQQQAAPAAAPAPAPGMDPDAALLADVLASQPSSAGATQAPVAAPEGPAYAPNGRVYVYGPTGKLGTMDESELGAAEGFKPATHAEVDHELALAGHSGLGSQVAAGGEALLRGATFGGSDYIQRVGAGIGGAIGNALADRNIDDTTAASHDLYDNEIAQQAGQDIALRKEAGGMRNSALEVLGAIAPALLTGGVGSVGALARLTPAGQLANLSAKLGVMLSARATTAIGRIGALAGTGAFEGAVDNATRTVLSDLTSGNVEITAERALEAAWDGAKWGGAIGGGLGALAEGAGAAVRGGKALAEHLPALPSVEDFANGRAFKAAMGKTNVKGVRQAERFGGPEAVGKTLLDEGIVTASDTLETIAEKAASKRTELGKRLGDMVKEADELSGGKGLSRSALKQKLFDEVIAPLKDSPVNRDVGEMLEKQFANLFDELSPSPVAVRSKDGAQRVLDRDSLTFEQADAWRKELDQRLNWEKIAPDVATESKRDMRRVMSDFWLDAADQAAERSGKAGFGDEIRAAKKKFSHVALADDLAQDAIKSKLSNRFVSPSDYGVGAAGAVLAGGPMGMVAGAAGAMANKLIRERGNQVIAATLYNLAKGAVKQEGAVESAVSTALRSMTLPQRVTPILARLTAKSAAPSLAVERMVAQARALQDPESNESHQLEAQTLQLAGESPELADAIKAKVMQKADFVVRTLGPSTDPGDPLGRQPMPVDRITRGRNERFMRAIQNPSAALERLATGEGSAEDLAVVKEMTPLVHKRWADSVVEGMVSGNIHPTTQQKQRLFRMLGQPVERAQTPMFVAFYQKLHAQQQPADPSAAPGQMPQQPAPKFDGKDLKMDQVFAGRTDQLMGGIGDG